MASYELSLRHSAIIIFIIILFLNSHMPDFHLCRQQITISYNCMYQIHNMFLTKIQNYPILTVICCWYIIVKQPKQSYQPKTTSFKQQILCSLLNSLFCWCSTVSSCSYFREQSSSGNHDNKVKLTPAVFNCFATTLQWSIPFPVKNFWLFLARTIKIASSIYCNNFKTLPQIQDGL